MPTRLAVTPGGIGVMLLAEAIVSLFPIIARLTTLPTLFQSALRSTVLAGALLPVVGSIPGVLTATSGWLWIFAGFVNLLHIFSSFRGFSMMPTGPALSIFFTYPLISVILASVVFGHSITMWSWVGILLAFSGVLWMNLSPVSFNEPLPNDENVGSGSSEVQVTWEGITWLLVSALTESIIYLFVLHGGDLLGNPLVSVFATNFWAAIPLIGYFVYHYILSPETHPFTTAPLETGVFTLANLIVGVGGLGLTFAAARMLPPGVYSVLVYVGVLFGFIYGFFLGDTLKMRDIIGSLLIIMGSFVGGRS